MIKILSFGGLCSLLAFTMGAKSSEPKWPPNYSYQVSVTAMNPELQCNGDSTIVTLRATWNDTGKPVVGYNQRVSTNGNGTVFRHGQAVTATDHGYLDVGQYDKDGIIRLRIYPQNNNELGFWSIDTPTFLGEIHNIHTFACAFSNDPTYAISGDVWNDRDADGRHDPNETSMRRVQIVIGHWFDPANLSAGSSYVGIPGHTQRTNREGEFHFTGLRAGDWDVCASTRRDRMIVSVNGTPVTPALCIVVPSLTPGDTHLSLGTVLTSR